MGRKEVVDIPCVYGPLAIHLVDNYLYQRCMAVPFVLNQQQVPPALVDTSTLRGYDKMMPGTRTVHANVVTPRYSIHVDGLAALEHVGEGGLLTTHEEHGFGPVNDFFNSHHVAKRCERAKATKEYHLPHHLTPSGGSILRREQWNEWKPRRRERRGVLREMAERIAATGWVAKGAKSQHNTRYRLQDISIFDTRNSTSKISHLCCF